MPPSEKLLVTLREYYRQYKPKESLFEGEEVVHMEPEAPSWYWQRIKERLA